ncbi:MAG: hypothetical protein A2945_02525 [Candidatus Liptonbacteria bacterium RIFCSPLOWO2_01_FULL_52_25]|uniref:Uncharacterized protein n=1 Tax=Candidatus Liptonbacteria bacterium RIFCSPLOWO2_01_FULL_52_25 TaxID=1798650 RepID=A0A1G2CEN9_9BACT|nr:MAG: hypothetical protein A2945_02525 [Candidatus Liptonbacteria bacterium RIFCSPLOWO2_01_FULL_52_25]
MRTKLFLLLAIAGIGVIAFAVLREWRSSRLENSPPPEAFLNQIRNEFDNSAPVETSTTAAISQKVLDTKTGTQSVSTPKFNCSGGSWDCYETYYVAMTKSASTKEAFGDLRARYSEDGYVRAMCHPLTHVIGRTASERFENPGDAYLEGDPFCWSGYYHGVLEGVIGRIGLKNLAERMDTICVNIKDREGYGFDYYNCVHGLGHGVMAITQNELWESLDYCDKLTGPWEQLSCASGAYMENIIADGKMHITKFLNPSEPLYPCNTSPDKYKNTCYLMQTSYMLKVNGRDFKKTFEWCSGVEEAHRRTCYESLGRDASGGTTSNVGQTHDLCMLGTDAEQRAHCVIGAVKDFISYFHSDAQAKAFCNSFEDEDLKQTCLTTGEGYYAQF